MGREDSSDDPAPTKALKVYRDPKALASLRHELDAIAGAGIEFEILHQAQSLALEPSLMPVFADGVFWPTAASIDNPLAVTQAYVARFMALNGVLATGDARSLQRNGNHWRVESTQGTIEAPNAIVAMGPWSNEVLRLLGLKLPLEVKRGYHRHYMPSGNARISRPVLDANMGCAVAPMQQGLRLLTGAEFTSLHAPPTPVQFGRFIAAAQELYPLGEPVESEPWMGRRPCLPDSRPAIGRALGQNGLWVNCGHSHWGLTLGPVSGRLLSEMIAGATPLCDPVPFAPRRFWQ